MKLINGRGQIGEKLKTLSPNNEVIIYHTWNFLDKEHKTQKNELDKLTFFLDTVTKDKKIIFISTSTTNSSPYLDYKRKAEKIVLSHSNNNLVVRLPSIIGKGIFSDIRDNILMPYGEINFVSLNEACDFITTSFNKTGVITLHGWTVSANTLKDIMEFSKNES